MSDDQEPILQFFEFGHLREDLQKVSAAFYGMAHGLVDTLPRNPERTVALRKLLEAKDAAVRAKMSGAGQKRPGAPALDPAP